MSDENRTLALMAGIAILAGPRRTRPLAGFLYGLFLSRAHGAGRDRVAAELVRLFDERTSAHARIDSLERRMHRRRRMERAMARHIAELYAAVQRLEGTEEATDGND